MRDATFESAARAFAALAHRIDPGAWERPGLGEWDVRALVGHTSRSLITVSTYLRAAAEREDIPGPVEYYTYVRDYVANAGADDIVERGRAAGVALGADPAATIDGLLRDVLNDLDGVDDPLITVIGGLGIRLSSYLPTRTFELAVHSLDIVAATGVRVALPDAVLDQATVLAARVAVATGQGEPVLMALTGRAALPDPFSVV